MTHSKSSLKLVLKLFSVLNCSINNKNALAPIEVEILFFLHNVMALNNNIQKKDCNEKRDKPACRQAGLLIKTNRDGWHGVICDDKARYKVL